MNRGLISLKPCSSHVQYSICYDVWGIFFLYLHHSPVEFLYRGGSRISLLSRLLLELPLDLQELTPLLIKSLGLQSHVLLEKPTLAQKLNDPGFKQQVNTRHYTYFVLSFQLQQFFLCFFLFFLN